MSIRTIYMVDVILHVLLIGQKLSRYQDTHGKAFNGINGKIVTQLSVWKCTSPLYKYMLQ